MSIRLLSRIVFLGCLTWASSLAVAADPPLPWAFKGKSAEGYSIDLVSLDPVPGTPLVRGSSVTFKIAVSYKNVVARGKIILVFQDEKNGQVTSGGPQVSADASGSEGTASLEQTVTVPAHSNELRLFVPLVPDGLENTSGELTFRYPIVESQKMTIVNGLWDCLTSSSGRVARLR
jgi:hypothetical protein